MANVNIGKSFEKIQSIVAWVTDTKGNVDHSTFETECQSALTLALVGHHFATGHAFRSLKGFLALDAACAMMYVVGASYEWDHARKILQTNVITTAWKYPSLPGARDIVAQGINEAWDQE